MQSILSLLSCFLLSCAMLRIARNDMCQTEGWWTCTLIWCVKRPRMSGLCVKLQYKSVVYIQAVLALWYDVHFNIACLLTRNSSPCPKRTFNIIWLSSVFVARYGFEFVEHTYLYHVTRRDVKHNFSVYFYMLYLAENSRLAWLLGLLAFIPQLIMTLSLGLRFYTDISFCCFVQTFAFVAFNKVCTSQVWYLRPKTFVFSIM